MASSVLLKALSWSTVGPPLTKLRPVRPKESHGARESGPPVRCAEVGFTAPSSVMRSLPENMALAPAKNARSTTPLKRPHTRSSEMSAPDARASRRGMKRSSRLPMVRKKMRNPRAMARLM